jgi:hypothetical protein
LNGFLGQLAALRAEIERMQAERQAFDNRAVFSSVFFSMREEVSSSAVTPGAQRRSAAVYQSSRNSDFLHELWSASLALGRDSFSPGATLAPLTVALCSRELMEWRALALDCSHSRRNNVMVARGHVGDGAHRRLWVPKDCRGFHGVCEIL